MYIGAGGGKIRDAYKGSNKMESWLSLETYTILHAVSHFEIADVNIHYIVISRIVITG